MATPAVRTTWASAGERSGEPLVTLEEKPLPSDALSVAGELALVALPWTLEKDGEQTRCELELDFGALPLQCKMLRLQLATSARHVEIHVDGVRRSMLGEDERSEVYFGTFRGVQAAAGEPPRFEVSQEFQQTARDHDVLKCIHRLRITFVSLTGDKRALELAKMRCFYVATASRPSAAAGGDAATSAVPSVADVMGMIGGLSLGQASPQMLLVMVQQMLEREVEAKISRALDAKLSVLSQRLAFSEQMLMQVQQKSASKDAQLEQKLDSLQHELSALRSQVVGGVVTEPRVEKEKDGEAVE